MYEIIIGRSEDDKKQFGLNGIVLLGKQYVKMGHVTSLSNKVYLDVVRSHVVFVCGKRGGGKSYTMGVIAEGMSMLPEEISKNLAIVMLDTMGIYWAMKYPNKKEEDLLKEWDIKAQGLDVKIFTPIGYYKKYKEQGIPTDFPFAIKPAELAPSDWCSTFGISPTEPVGVIIERVVSQLIEESGNFSIMDVIERIRQDNKSEQAVKYAAENRFLVAETWGLFDVNGTPFEELIAGGQITVLDVSCYATAPGAADVRALVIGLVAEKLFIQRMIARKFEEYEAISKSVSYFEPESEENKKIPLVWLIIDEAHEFIPNDKTTVASQPLITAMREGRQPGISLILATQQPGKIHTDVMTQSDIVIAHRITAKVDTEALGALMQSYMREGLDVQLDNLPREKGAALIFDDTNERLFPIRVRPRITWHGGESPAAMQSKKSLI